MMNKKPFFTLTQGNELWKKKKIGLIERRFFLAAGLINLTVWFSRLVTAYIHIAWN